MRRHRRKHDQDLRKLDHERFDFVFEDDLLDQLGLEPGELEDLDRDEGHPFDFNTWRADLTERSTKRARMRERDMRRGLYRERRPGEQALERSFDLDDDV
jgi:hypothetical protein